MSIKPPPPDFKSFSKYELAVRAWRLTTDVKVEDQGLEVIETFNGHQSGIYNEIWQGLSLLKVKSENGFEHTIELLRPLYTEYIKRKRKSRERSPFSKRTKKSRNVEDLDGQVAKCPVCICDHEDDCECPCRYHTYYTCPEREESCDDSDSDDREEIETKTVKSISAKDLYNRLSEKNYKLMTNCYLCYKRVRFVSVLRDHIQTHFDYLIDVKMRMKIDSTERNLICNFANCGCHCKSTVEYALHMDTHDVDDLYCPFCNILLNKPVDYAKHMVHFHRKEYIDSKSTHCVDFPQKRKQLPPIKVKKLGGNGKKQHETSSVTQCLLPSSHTGDCLTSSWPQKTYHPPPPPSPPTTSPPRSTPPPPSPPRPTNGCFRFTL